jgi:hypothetical protein
MLVRCVGRILIAAFYYTPHCCAMNFGHRGKPLSEAKAHAVTAAAANALKYCF